MCKKLITRRKPESSRARENTPQDTLDSALIDHENANGRGNSDVNFDVNEFFDFSIEGPDGLDWLNKYFYLKIPKYSSLVF